MTTIIRSTGAMSWIDPQTGLPEVDANGHPGITTTRAVIVGERAYRFSNFLEIQMEVEDGSISSASFTEASGMYRSPSFARIASAPVGQIGRAVNMAPNATTFRQVVGCRTVSPETIGTAGGAAVGGLGGLALGVFVLGTGGWGLLALGVGGLLVGAGTGKEVSEFASAFPPIWTELELTVSSDGSTSQRLIANSLFPSTTFYRQQHETDPRQYSQVSNYDAVPALNRWKEHGWGEAPGVRSGAISPLCQHH